MGLSFDQIRAVFNGQSYQIRTKIRPVALDDFPAGQIGTKGLCSAPNSTERTDQVLLAESSVMEPDLTHGEVLPEVQVIATRGKARGCFCGLWRGSIPKMIQHEQRPCMSLPIACYSFAQKLCFIDPCMRPVRQERRAYGGFLFGHSWLLSRAVSIPHCPHFVSMYQVKKPRGVQGARLVPRFCFPDRLEASCFQAEVVLCAMGFAP
ncbi:hypothetical protein GSU75_05910 [Pseudomonas savastanoi pv. phaseolicola]|nr:hypothetical protein [Pseudomonas savastanoi pv. phaseolicola]